MTAPAVDLLPRAVVAGAGFSPTRVVSVELTEALPAVPAGGPDQPGGRPYRQVLVLARLLSEPVGVCEAALGADGIAPDQLGRLLWDALREPVTERFTSAGQPAPAELTAEGLRVDPDTWPFWRSCSAVLAAAPAISVVVCTRDRPALLRTCLRRLEQQQYPRFEVVVVDNAASTDAVRTLVDSLAGGPVRFRYHAEPRPGLSWARNAGITAATSDIVAFLDDDDEPDRHWLGRIALGFSRGSDVGCVAGMILPATLDTAAEDLFERLGGHRMGRGFIAETFTRSGPQSPLFPLPPFGTGANMAFRKHVLARIGGFDVALGAGTLTYACEDTLAFSLTLLAGYEIAYEPSALMWHHHRPDMDGLRRQLHGYSIGLTAFYAALLRHSPGVMPGLLRLLPAASRYLRSTGTPDAPLDLLAELNRRHVQGLLAGPLAYVRSVRMQRRAAWPEPVRREPLNAGS
jgi:O-antigen biosynthesis protein